MSFERSFNFTFISYKKFYGPFNYHIFDSMHNNFSENLVRLVLIFRKIYFLNLSFLATLSISSNNT